MNREQLFVKMALSAWEMQINRATELLNGPPCLSFRTVAAFEIGEGAG